MIPEILLDVSRLITRGDHPVPTGIDRVELAYAEHLIAEYPDRTRFIAAPVPGIWNELSRDRAHRLVARIGDRWRAGRDAGHGKTKHRRTLAGAWAAGAMPLGAAPSRGHSIYLLVSHHHLDQPRLISRILAQTGAAFVPLIHDLIPIDYAEYVRPGEPRRHQKRIEAVARLADAIIVNSRATAVSLAPWLRAAERDPPVLIAPLGVERLIPTQDSATAVPGHAYFVCVGTIEPRKNHHLLLQIWRRLAERSGAGAPHLHIIGKRGWENQAVFSLLDRCKALTGLVIEHNAAADSDLASLMTGARALLMPSFAEGYGLPIVEALAMGVPVVCSDLPAFREVGGDAAEFFDPLDGAAWIEAVTDYATPDSARRRDQIGRLAGWSAPTWADHMAAVLTLCESLGSGESAQRTEGSFQAVPITAS